MGQLVVKLVEPVGNVADILGGRRKRKRSIDSLQTNGEQTNNESQSPKKKKLLTTTQYIYQALFKEQKNSDIAIMALGKVWNLHKVYLSQSPYFYSMFNGSWKEACQDFVHIKILDERITLDALDAVFGSMYSDEIEIDAKGVISVLATATLFHLDGIIEKCAEVMIESINAETAINYYESACQYGCQNVKKAAFVWLETNLLCIYTKYPNLLRQISIELMTSLISSPDLYVLQTEFSLYTLLRNWIYLRLHPDFDPENPQQQQELQLQLQKQTTQTSNSMSLASTSPPSSSSPSSTTENSPSDIAQNFFTNRREKRSFLSTPDGQQFLRPFMALRTQYLTNHYMDLKIVLNDNIIPKEWLHNHVLSNWNSILKVDHIPEEEGPTNLDPEEFYKNCMRCGRILLEPGYQKWRWTGFNFGLDLILIADSRILSIRRHHRNEHERLLSLQTKRQFMIRASVTSINSQRQPVFTQKSDITSLCLEKNEEITLMVMDSKLVHPLLISVNVLVVPPASQTFKENLLVCEEFANASVPISEIGANSDRSTTPTNTNLLSSEAAAGGGAIFLVPPSPPNATVGSTNQLRAASATSTISSSSSNASTSSYSSTDFL
ncbi:germ cell-less [Haematobia irritans]|uniref:germ cell-less n=1 Tax=Haematobia irritans TaxID=7368 RepID=UPI003F4FA306